MDEREEKLLCFIVLNADILNLFSQTYIVRAFHDAKLLLTSFLFLLTYRVLKEVRV